MDHSRTHTLREILVNALLIFAAVTVVGTISNVLILLVGWLTSIPVTASLDAQGYTDAEQQAVWLILAVIAMLTCMICSFAIVRAVGTRAAQYRVGSGQSRKLSIPAMLGTVLPALVLHGIHCAVLAELSMAYLVIASPVQYIARFLGKGENTIFIEDAFDFPKEILWTALLIYLVLLAAACTSAYAVGFRQRIRETEKKEKDDAASARYEERKARLEAEGGNAAADTPEWKPEIRRETLSGKTEKRLLELNRRKILETILFLVVWTAADVLIWYLWSKTSGRDMFSPSAFFFAMILVVPFWPMKKHEVFLGKTYYAQVVDIRPVEESLPKAMRYVGSKQNYNTTAVRVRRDVYLRPKGGASEKLEFRERDTLSFKTGDHVLKLSAFRYPVNCNFDDAHDVYCMNCGQSNTPGRKKCVRCRFPLGREK